MAQKVKNLPTSQETGFQSLGREDPQEKEGQPTPVFLPGRPNGQRGLAGCSPRGHKESDMTSRLNNDLEKNFKKYSHFYFSELNNPEKLTV